VFDRSNHRQAGFLCSEIETTSEESIPVVEEAGLEIQNKFGEFDKRMETQL
jgi:hypothetical protein